MQISDVIKKVGDEKVQIQSVATSIIKVQQKKHDAEVTIATSRENGQKLMSGITTGKMPIVGILVWMTREQWEEATKEAEKPKTKPKKGSKP